jgi:hypothetical protein
VDVPLTLEELHCSLIPYNTGQPGITTSTDATVVSQGTVFAEFTGVQFHDTAKCAAVITSATGNFCFSDCDFEDAETTVINTSTAYVSMTDAKSRFGDGTRLTVLGNGLYTRFNGVPNPTRSTDVSRTNFGMGAFTAGVPNNWIFQGGSAANIADQGGGYVRLLFNSAGVSCLTYILPAGIRERRSLYTIRVLVRYTDISDAILTFYCRRSDTTNIQSYRRFTAFCHGTAWFYDIPIICGYDTGGQSIDISWSTASGAGVGYCEIAGLQLFECAETAMWQDVIDSTYRREFQDPLNLGPAIAKAGSNRTVQQAIAVPTAGTWKVNDRVLRNPQVVGQPKAWVCTVGGTPGTWVSEGLL